MKKMVLNLFLINLMLASTTYAHDLSIKYDADIKTDDKKVMESVLSEVASFLPGKMKEGLPKNLEIKITQLTAHKVIPDEVCSSTTGHSVDYKDIKLKDRPFVYGQYNQYRNVLTINTPVMIELLKGREKSKRINCQHKSLYDQAIATMVHELTHAYDFNNGRISNSMEYIARAGFKKGLLKIKNRNLQAMRSADVYELVNIAESFAVNMEYFTMDPEFFCRKPSMFNYFKNLFNIDPYPTRTCSVNNTVMVSTPASGFIPIEIDASRVYRIDYLMASPGKGAESGFGHSMFRLVICAPERFDAITNRTIPATLHGKKCLDDKLFHLVVSYRANVEDAKLNYMKGVFGGYPSMLYILNFSDVLDEYNRDELRDISSFPLILTAKEREEFILKVKEEHWNYRGSYKFINSNCATESYDLLKSALERTQLNTKSSVSPKGVLEDLDALSFLSVKSTETEVYKAKTDQIVLAYKAAYSYKMKSDKADKEAVKKFIDESTVNSRLARFQKFSKTKLADSELNTQVALLKERLVAAASFSVMEQQILRTVALKYRKQAADMFTTTKDEKIKDLLKETGAAFSQSFTSLSKNGYGIPFADEMVSRDDLVAKLSAGAEAMANAEKMLRELMPNEFAALESINKNIQTYNKYSLQIRKEFRAKLEEYVHQVLKNLSHDDYTREVMESAAAGNNESLKKVRELLGKDLVSDKEILDVKLRKLIQELL
ncbi:MAG: DUF4105 domain-containing protein [Bacteriovorax sp.]|nr:DUF4105 domain-containing protein [Bacteriovorax sp.]